MKNLLRGILQKKSIKHLIEFYRIKDWFKILGYPLIGLLLANSDIEIFIVNIIISALGLAYCFSINDYWDHLKEGEKNYVGKIIETQGKKKVLFACFFPFFLCLPLLLLIKSYPLIIFLCFMLLASIYSMPPIRLRNKPILDLIMNSLMFPCLFAFSFFDSFNSLTTFIFFFINFIYYFFVSELIHQMAHYKKDKSCGRTTTLILLGKKKTLYFLKIVPIFPLLFSSYFLFSLDIEIITFAMISIVTNLMRIKKFKKLTLKTDFCELRTKIYGLEEGISYFLAIFIFKLINLKFLPTIFHL
ncbi:MAG: UbiA family prenyltransferase [Candidatus Aenigmatarchaeota archaeon]